MAETSQPQERAQQDLPPKSYSDAVTNKASEPSVRADANDAPNPSANGHIEKHTDHTLGNAQDFSPIPNNIPNSTDSQESEEAKLPKDESGGEKVDMNKMVYEKYDNNRGDRLTSVKPEASYEKSPKHDQETAPRDRKKANTTHTTKKHDEKSHLASGRRAGAGWERSA